MMQLHGWQKFLGVVEDIGVVGVKLGYVALLLAASWLIVAAGLWLVL